MRIAIVVLLCAGAAMAQPRPKALLYMMPRPDSVQAFLNHADKIDILVPTWYSVDGSGLVWGGPDEHVLQVAKQHHVAVMPIIVNTGTGTEQGFNQQSFHQLASDPAARAHFIGAMVEECRKHGYTGFQFDFENVLWTDRDALTQVVTEAAAALHKAGFQLSIATVPNAPGYPGQGRFARWIYANWRGAYDLKALAQQVDLICLMTYDEHTSYTPPGPVAGYTWVVQNLEYALQSVPKEKLSLGIPLYGYRWYAGEPGKTNATAETATYVGNNDVQMLIDTYNPSLQWDDTDKAAWFYFYRDQTREWVFYTDARTFKERLDLVKARGLEGFCSWVLGQESPAIWDELPSHR
ncbi:MAG TPA: glycosyl hydrolase family 18 protein [Terriglobales bacterium]|nr:glycosyl hydrolase family 18 protein [Terriglobales bacterium]